MSETGESYTLRDKALGAVSLSMHQPLSPPPPHQELGRPGQGRARAPGAGIGSGLNINSLANTRCRDQVVPTPCGSVGRSRWESLGEKQMDFGSKLTSARRRPVKIHEGNAGPPTKSGRRMPDGDKEMGALTDHQADVGAAWKSWEKNGAGRGLEG